jgi:DNA-binding winged helix-turn-helix (wHTH) protein
VGEALHSSRSVRFGRFEVDLPAGELRKCGLKLKLSGQPFQVLAILLERPGEVVTREELQKRLWLDTFVDVDHNLNTAINKIREALGDSAENPRFVETLPRRGYRFIAPVDVGAVRVPAQPGGPRIHFRIWKNSSGWMGIERAVVTSPETPLNRRETMLRRCLGWV